MIKTKKTMIELNHIDIKINLSINICMQKNINNFLDVCHI